MKSSRSYVLSVLLTAALAGILWSCSRMQTGAPAGADVLVREADELRLRYRLESSHQAVEKYKQALELLLTAGDTAAAAEISRKIGAVLEEIGEPDGAMSAYARGLEYGRQAGANRLEGLILSDLGLAQLLAGDHERGKVHCDEALAIAKKQNYELGAAQALNCLGEVAYHRGNLSKALELHQQAGAVWRSLGDRQGRAESSTHLGHIHSDLNEYDRAAKHYENALTLARENGDLYTQTIIWNSIGRMHERLGEYQDALNSFDQASRLAGDTGDPVWLGASLSGIASVYEHMGDNQAAEGNWMRSLQQFRRAGLRLAEADVLMSVGEMRLASGDSGAALDRFQEALRLADELENARFRARALQRVGLAYQSRGDPKAALANYREALAAGRSGEDRRFEASVMGDIGQAYRELGEIASAREHFVREAEVSRAARDLEGEARGLYRLAQLLATEGKLAEAQERIERSLVTANSLRQRVASGNMRASYVAAVHRYHELYIDVLMRLAASEASEQRVASALEASEGVRARSLLDSLIEASVDVRSGVDLELLAREKALKRNLDGKAQQLMRLNSATPNENRVGLLEQEIHDLSADVDRIEAEIRSKSPRYAGLMQPQPLRLAQIQQEVLDSDTVLLEYALGGERSYLWVVTSSEIAGFELPPRAEIETAARHLHDILTARRRSGGEKVADYRLRVRAADNNYRAAARRLSKMLLEPAGGRIKGKRLLVVSDGVLQYIPFAALPAPGVESSVPLVVEHEIVNLPSASTLAVLRREIRDRDVAGPPSVAVFADPVFGMDDPRLVRVIDGEIRAHNQVTRAADLHIPRLPASRREAKAIVALASGAENWLAIDFEATREAAMSARLGRHRIVHFATHAEINTELAGLSRIILSMVDRQGRPLPGFLRFDDIYNLDLPVELVVLSACNSALGKEVRGEGLVGLVRGFFYAGSRRVLASLWKVDDEATRDLMTRFYRHMLTAQQSPASALRQAQIEMLQQPDWGSPYYWAAFVLQGEWR